MDSDPTQPTSVDDFLIMRRHLSSHKDAHPMFDAAHPVGTDGGVTMFRDGITGLPQEQVLTIIATIQKVSSGLHI